MAARPVPLFRMPADLAAQGYRVRAELARDIPFLRRLFASTRAEEMVQLQAWSAQQKAAFLDQQFDMQRTHYRTRIDDCHFYIVEHGGAPIGRLYLQQRVVNLHVVDISLLPEVRGTGLGTALLTALFAQAANTGRGVGIMVERFNPAQRLYRRLGFVEIADTGFHVEMERPLRVAMDGDAEDIVACVTSDGDGG